MPRRTVWISEELDALVATELPDVNWSAALAAGIRGLLDCGHEQLACTSCGAATTRTAVVSPALERFYSKVMFELGLKVTVAGYQGAAAIVRRVATDHAVPGLAAVPVPRATRAQIEDRHAAVDFPLEADSRRRHPTNHPNPKEQTA